MENIARARFLLGAVAAVAALLALSGCAEGSHIGRASQTAAELAADLTGMPQIASASARYDPADAAGESVTVAAALRHGADAADWVKVLTVLHRALTDVRLDGVRQQVAVTTRGDTGAEFRPHGTTDWPDRATIAARLEGAAAFTSLTGTPVQVQLNSVSSTPVYTVVGRSDSAAFVTRIADHAAALDGVEVSGWGFRGSGAAPRSTSALYRLIAASAVPPAGAGAGTGDGAASGSAASGSAASPTASSAAVSWGDGVAAVQVVSRSEAIEPSARDVRLAARVGAAAADGTETAFIWSADGTSATVTYGACRVGTLDAFPADRALAARLARSGQPVDAPGGAGACTTS